MDNLQGHLTVILPVFNEAHRIEVALRNFYGRAPILVIDNFSEDETVAIARKYTNRILQRRNHGFASREDYQFMFAQAKTEWILIMYAGHYFPIKLVDEIEQAVISGAYDAVCLSGIAVQYGGQTNVYGWNFRRNFKTTRLFRRAAIDLCQSRIHHELPFAGDRARVYFPPLNKAYYIANFRDDDILMMSRKTVTYCEEEAQQLFRTGATISGVKVAFSFFYHLAKRLVWRLGIMEGVPGIIISISEAYRCFCTNVRLWELTREFDSTTMKQRNAVARDDLLRASKR